MADFETLLGQLPQLPIISLLRSQAMAYATVNAMHILGLGMFMGATIPLDLGVLCAPGFAWTRTVDGPLRRLAIAAFLFTVLTGLLLFSVRPGDYLGNSAFLTKLSVLLLAGGNALLFQHIRWPEVRRFQAGLSLTLWLVVLFAGRWIGFIQ